MRKSILLVAAALLTLGVASPAAANWGPGFLYSDFPVGVFFGVNDETVVHVGLDLVSNDIPEGGTGIETEFGIVGALVYDLVGGDDWGFGVAPAFSFRNFSPAGDGDSSNRINIMAGLKGHWDPTDWLSFWIGHGLTVSIFSPGGDADSTTDFFTSGQPIGSAGFTFWIP